MLALFKSRKIHVLTAILLFLTITVYLNGLNGSFVSDDKGIVSGTPITDLRTLLYTVSYKIGGLNPLWYRLVNLFFHAGSTLLVFLILLRFFLPWVSFVTAILFGIHPIHVEAVTWISGGGYVQYSFFFLLSFYFYLAAQKKKWLFFLSVFSFVLCLHSSPAALSLLIPFLLYEWLFGSVKKNWPKLLMLSGVTAIFVIQYVFGIVPRLDTFKTGYYQDSATYNPLFQIPVALSSYLELMLWPDKLTLYHTELAFTVTNFIVRVIVVFLYFVLLAVFFKKNKLLFFWLSLFVISLLPTLTPYRVAWIVAERYIYLGALSLLLPVSYGLEKLYKKYGRLILFFTVIVILLLSLRTVIRNVDWTNEDTLWFATARTSPSSWVNHNNLGDVYARHGEYARAVDSYERAISLNPSYADAYNNMANVYVKLGKKSEAIINYEYAVSLNPNLWQAYYNMSALFYEADDLTNAAKLLDKAIRANPTESKLFSHRGVIYLRLGSYEKAEGAFKEALAVNKDDELAQKGLAELARIKHNP